MSEPEGPNPQASPPGGQIAAAVGREAERPAVGRRGGEGFLRAAGLAAAISIWEDIIQEAYRGRAGSDERDQKSEGEAVVMQVQGVIHGTTIELKENPGLADGVEIEVILLPRGVPVSSGPGVPGERTTAAGMLAHLPPEVDQQIEAIIRERKQGAFREVPDELPAGH